MLRRISKRALAALATTAMTAGLVVLWTTAAPAAPVTLEAESAALSGGARVESEHTGYSGSGYAGGFTDVNRGNAQVTFTTNATAGQNSLILRYANGTGTTRTLTLTVNGTARTLSLPATAGWTSWSTVGHIVPLNATGNSVVVSYGTTDNGNVNVDNIVIEPAAVTTDGQEAESATLSGGARVETEHAGYSGTGYVGGFVDPNRGAATATFTTSSTGAGQSELTLRYANGTGVNRSLTVTVNGSALQVTLPATAGWSTWGTATTSVTLNAGTNTIAVSYGAADNGNVNLDNIKLTPVSVTTTTTPPPAPAGSYEMETGFASGGATAASGVADLPSAGARIIRTVNQTSAGDATITLRYNNTAAAARTVSVYANGLRQQQLSLPTGSGQTVTHTLNLRAGLNMIGYQVDPGDSGGVQLDTISVTNTAGLAQRGATLPYTTYEAENGTTNGQKLAPGRGYTTVAAESSGRSAVTLTGTGQYVDVVLTEAANAITVRASIPDSPGGGGLTAPLELSANGQKITDLTLNSRYSWLYGPYPFLGSPGGERPHRYYDDSRTLLPQTYQAGTVLRLAKATAATAYITIDLVEAEIAAPALTAPAGYVNVMTHGATPNDTSDDSNAFRAAVAAAQGSTARGVWIPEGSFTLGGRVEFNGGVAIRGAGIWHTILKGVNRKGGFLVTGGNNTEFADFTIDGDNEVRDDAGGDAGIEGDLGTGSSIHHMAFNHTKVGLWINGRTNGLHIAGLRVRNTMADGINITVSGTGGSSNVRVEQSTLRNTGDDAMAMWSRGFGPFDVTSSVFAFNTVALPILANGTAIYGGAGNRIEDNLISDTVFNGAGIEVGSRYTLGAMNGTALVQRNTLTRTGSHHWDFNAHIGALWIWAAAEDGDINGRIEIRDMQIDSSSYQGLYASYSRRIADLVLDNVTINGTGANTSGENGTSNANSHGMQFDAVTGAGQFSNVRISGLAGAGSAGLSSPNNQFTVTRGAGNSGW